MSYASDRGLVVGSKIKFTGQGVVSTITDSSV